MNEDLDCKGPHTYMMFIRRSIKVCGTCGYIAGMTEKDHEYMNRVLDYARDLIKTDGQYSG